MSNLLTFPIRMTLDHEKTTNPSRRAKDCELPCPPWTILACLKIFGLLPITRIDSMYCTTTNGRPLTPFWNSVSSRFLKSSNVPFLLSCKTTSSGAIFLISWKRKEKKKVFVRRGRLLLACWSNHSNDGCYQALGKGIAPTVCMLLPRSDKKRGSKDSAWWAEGLIRELRMSMLIIPHAGALCHGSNAMLAWHLDAIRLHVRKAVQSSTVVALYQQWQLLKTADVEELCLALSISADVIYRERYIV